MRASSVLTTAASLLLASTVFVAAQGTQKQGPGAEGGPPQGQMQREGQQGQQGKQAPQKGDRGENGQQKGSSQAQEREGPKGKQQVQKEGQKEQQGKQQGQRERTEGQGGRAESQKGAEPKGKAGERTEGQRERTEGQQGGRNDAQKGERTDTQRGERSGGSVTLTTEQRTRVRETVLRGSNAPRVNNVNFSIRVGTVVPTSVHIVEVAPVLVEVHPEWRGFFYFIVNDQIIIVDRNHHIVAVLDV